jgi:hypothetical protein
LDSENADLHPASFLIQKMHVWIQTACRSRKCLSGSKKLANPKNAELSLENLQIQKMQIWIRKTCRSGHGKLVYPDTENLQNFHLSSGVAIVPPPTPTPSPGTEQHTVFKMPKSKQIFVSSINRYLTALFKVSFTSCSEGPQN